MQDFPAKGPFLETLRSRPGMACRRGGQRARRGEASRIVIPRASPRSAARCRRNRSGQSGRGLRAGGRRRPREYRILNADANDCREKEEASSNILLLAVADNCVNETRVDVCEGRVHFGTNRARKDVATRHLKIPNFQAQRARGARLAVDDGLPLPTHEIPVRQTQPDQGALRSFRNRIW